MEKVGRSQMPDRDLYILELETLQDPVLGAHILDGHKFICFMVGNFTGLSCESVTAFGGKSIKAGAVYFCTWGPDCSMAHDCIDLARDPEETDDTLIPTSWHEKEALYEALYFAIYNAFPSDTYFDDCTAMVAMVLNNSEWSSELRRWMSNPEELQARIVSDLEPGLAS
jgi:hypothetical protein